MRTDFSLTKCQTVILLSTLGFLLTGILAYPYGFHWDSARTFSLILRDGHAHLDNWLGWYFPLLWEYLYKLTNIPHIIGCYINLIYWFGITILYINAFDYKKYSLLLYFVFAWFPGTLLFIINITNNALMFVTLLLGIAIFTLYLNSHKRKWLLFSIIIVLQCIFIRREAIVAVVPLIFVFLYLAFYKYGRFRSTIFSFSSTLLILFSVLVGERKLINTFVPNYYYMDALSVTCFHDMAAVSYMKKEQILPSYIFKEEFRDGKACLEDILSINSGNDGKDSILCGDRLFSHIHKYVKGGDVFHTYFSTDNILELYKKNISDYIWFRLGYVIHFLSDTYFFHMYCVDDDIYYDPPKSSSLVWAISYIFAFILGPLKNIYFISLVVLLLDFFKFINYRCQIDKILVRSIIIISFVQTIACLLGSIDIQYRYLYPVCILQYLSFVYLLTILKVGDLTKSLGNLIKY